MHDMIIKNNNLLSWSGEANKGEEMKKICNNITRIIYAGFFMRELTFPHERANIREIKGIL